MTPNPPWLEPALHLTGATTIEPGPRIQSLWSGYGEILRATVDGTPVVIKHVRPPTVSDHPRGWSSDRSHKRKLRSYAVELAWYQHWNQRCFNACRVPATIAASQIDNDAWLFVLEDLDHAGFQHRHHHLDAPGVHLCLRWLAEFHATFLGQFPHDLWETGTYWHLATRPDELAAMPDGDLKGAAHKIDLLLETCRFKTIVHGDAKVANFCFSPHHTAVAAVDFQYVGGGPGIKDVAYFLGSCLDEHECQRHAPEYLDHYFAALRSSVSSKHPKVDTGDLETEWRHLFPVAWTDFYRFLSGWCPSHPKMNPYSERLATLTLNQLARATRATDSR